MPRRSSVSALPQEVRRWLERSLEESGFGNYALLAALLKDKGFEISKTSLHRWGQDIKCQRDAIRSETEAARQLMDGSPDDSNSRSEAMLALLQTGMVRGLRVMAMADLEDDPTEQVMTLAKIGKDAATMARANIDLKKYKSEIEDSARKRLLDEQRAALEAMPTKGGVTAQTKAAIREALGIV